MPAAAQHPFAAPASPPVSSDSPEALLQFIGTRFRGHSVFRLVRGTLRLQKTRLRTKVMNETAT
eukprot:14094808-Alexandrium_andersonii.AAC.1